MMRKRCVMNRLASLGSGHPMEWFDSFSPQKPVESQPPSSPPIRLGQSAPPPKPLAEFSSWENLSKKHRNDFIHSSILNAASFLLVTESCQWKATSFCEPIRPYDGSVFDGQPKETLIDLPASLLLLAQRTEKWRWFLEVSSEDILNRRRAIGATIV